MIEAVAWSGATSDVSTARGMSVASDRRECVINVVERRDAAVDWCNGRRDKTHPVASNSGTILTGQNRMKEMRR